MGSQCEQKSQLLLVRKRFALVSKIFTSLGIVAASAAFIGGVGNLFDCYCAQDAGFAGVGQNALSSGGTGQKEVGTEGVGSIGVVGGQKGSEEVPFLAGAPGLDAPVQGACTARISDLGTMFSVIKSNQATSLESYVDSQVASGVALDVIITSKSDSSHCPLVVAIESGALECVKFLVGKDRSFLS